jgi:hypothetical protein
MKTRYVVLSISDKTHCKKMILKQHASPSKCKPNTLSRHQQDPLKRAVIARNLGFEAAAACERLSCTWKDLLYYQNFTSCL